MDDDDQQITDEHKTTQFDEDGNEIFIKDPIQDIMSDRELEVATERLTSLIEEGPEEEE